MAGKIVDDKFMQMFGGSAAQAAAPASADPTAAAAPQQAVDSPAAPTGKVVDSQFMQMFGQSQQAPAMAASSAPAEPQGVSPLDAIPESPLSIIDRARLGWAKTPAAQQNMLSDHFGKENVQLVGQGEQAGFAVKQHGKWFQVDPNFNWSFSGASTAAGAAAGAALAGPAGIVPGAIAGAVAPSLVKNIKDLPGDIAQFAGQYGLKAAAATEGAAQGAAAGASVGALGGPAGAAALGLAGGVIGAGIGAMTEDGIETGGRYALSKMGASDPASLPKNQDEAAKQLVASFMFGAEGELGGKAIGLGVNAATKAVAGAVDRLSDTPAGKQVAAKMLSVISGLGENLQRVRVEDPQAMVPYDRVAAADGMNRTDRLGEMMKARVQSFLSEAQAKLRAVGKRYDAVDQAAQTVEYQPYQAATETTLDLLQNGYMKNSKIVKYQDQAGLAVDLTANDRGVLSYVKNSLDKINQASFTGKSFGYDEVRNVIKTLQSKLYQNGDNSIADPNVRRIVSKFASSLESHLDVTMPREAAALKQTLDKTYGPAKELISSLADKSEGQPLDTFLKQIVKDDGSFNAELMQSLRDTLGTSNPTTDILRMHVAKKSTGIWGGGKIMGIPVGSPAIAKVLATGYSSAKSAVTESASGIAQTVPYLNKALTTLQKVAPAERASFLKDPHNLDALWQSVSQAAAGEDQAKQQLLQAAGVDPEQAGQ